MKILHSADWQIGKPYARVSDHNKRAILQYERFAAIERIANIAKEETVDLVLVAGDLFDSNTVDNTTVSKTCAAIGGIEIPFIIIPGNHDHGGPGSIWNQRFFLREQSELAPNLQLLDKAEVFPTDTAIILPCPLLQRAESLDTTQWLRDTALYESLGNDKPRIVLGHGSTQAFTSDTLNEDSESEATNLLNLDRLPIEQIDYIALGDWHGTKQINEKAWYSGTPEPDRFQKGEQNQPGNILIADVSRSSSPKVAPIRTAALQWNQLAFNFTDDESLSDFQQQISGLLGNRVDKDLLRLELTGTLGIEASTELERVLESMTARLLRLKLANNCFVVPSDSEIEEITQRQEDPVISSVARSLVEQSNSPGQSGEIARLALRELYGACLDNR